MLLGKIFDYTLRLLYSNLCDKIAKRKGGIILIASINAWCLPSEYTTEQQLKAAKAAGFDAIEINIGEPNSSDPLSFDFTASNETFDKIAALAAETGIAISSISTSLLWKYPLTDNDGALAQKGIGVVKRMIDAAAILKAGAVLVVPGCVTKDVSYKTAYERATKAIGELAVYAEQKGIVIGVENVWNKFLMSPLEMKAFIGQFSSKFVKAYFDIGNVLQFSYPQHWIEVLAEDIVRVHIKDFKTEIGNITGFTNLLQGDIDWKVAMDALRAVGYDGYVTCELSPYVTCPVQLATDTRKHMEIIFNL